MDLERVSSMKVEELKNCLRLRGLKVSGKKEELVARVFAAIENDVPLVKTAQEVEKEIAFDYQQKLNMEEGGIVPDPFRLDSEWLNEEDGINYWSVTLYPDIFAFLQCHPSELANKDLSDYKTSKAYSYYAQGWLLPLQFNNISGGSKYCILKGACRPSQRINDVPHKLWICIQKLSGKSMSSHCTCMAGMIQTCNHVGAALFRIEAASRLGLNSPSCTSQACEWLPNNKTVTPMKIKDMELCRNDFGKRGKTKCTLNPSPKKKFNPIEKSNRALSLEETAHAVSTVCKESDCIIFSALPKPAMVAPSKEKISVKTHDQLVIESREAEGYLQAISQISLKEILDIEQLTKGQSENPSWFSYRRHVITASKGHDVKTRMAAVRKASEEVNLTSILNKVKGMSHINPDLPALKYGRSMESDAANSFEEIFKKSHRNVVTKECGLFLCEEIPFVGGSPDRIVECDCCGQSCLEIKCPFSIRHLSPESPEAILPYMKRENNISTLSSSHKYYTQCQIQMAATQLQKCYFFVWTAHGNILQEIYFDERLWIQLKKDFVEFYSKFYVPSMFK